MSFFYWKIIIKWNKIKSIYFNFLRFACSDPTIHVKQNDNLRFICPDSHLSSDPHAQSVTLYEKGYILGYNDTEHFQNCNATGSFAKFLNCVTKIKIVIWKPLAQNCQILKPFSWTLAIWEWNCRTIN